MVQTLFSYWMIIDIGNIISKVFKWGLFLIILAIVLWIASKFWLSYKTREVESKIRKLGVKDIFVRSINNEVVDDTLSRAAIGHMIAGEYGMIAGAASGGRHEKTVSVTFWIRYGDGSKQEVTFPSNSTICHRLLNLIEKREFDAW